MQYDMDAQLKQWLAEDIGMGDVTTLAILDIEHESEAIIHVKTAGLLAGTTFAKRVFELMDNTLIVDIVNVDGTVVQVGDVIMRVKGKSASILKAERLALNLMQRLSGIATKTKQFVDAIAQFETNIVDTRKTTPGHRLMEKYAVRVGGGKNHRFGLYDAVMIKDNHIKAAGSITNAVTRARAYIPHTMKIEVETENLTQVVEAVKARADIIMLDNMDYALMKEAVTYIKNEAPHILTEASGGVNLTNVAQMAATGVEFISIGSLTYSFQNMDISLDLNEVKNSSRR